MGALALLLVFIASIGINLAQGKKPNCHCFGELHSALAGWKTLARNGVLVTVAGFVVLEGKDGAGPSAVVWLGTLSAAELVALVVGLVVLGLLQPSGGFWFTCSGRTGIFRYASGHWSRS